MQLTMLGQIARLYKKLYTQHIKPEMYNTPEGSLYILDSWLWIVEEHNTRNARIRFQRDLDYLLNVDWRD